MSGWNSRCPHAIDFGSLDEILTHQLHVDFDAEAGGFGDGHRAACDPVGHLEDVAFEGVVGAVVGEGHVGRGGGHVQHGGCLQTEVV